MGANRPVEGVFGRAAELGVLGRVVLRLAREGVFGRDGVLGVDFGIAGFLAEEGVDEVDWPVSCGFSGADTDGFGVDFAVAFVGVLNEVGAVVGFVVVDFPSECGAGFTLGAAVAGAGSAGLG